MTVHFTAVCERFSSYDTTFSITTASELKDSKLSAACSLHAASGSTSSSTSSIRRRRLGEIAEEDEEEQQRASKRQSVDEVATGSPEAASTSDLITSPPGPRPETPVTLNADPAASPDQGNFTTATDPPEFTGADSTSPSKSFDTTERRLSSQSTRPEFYGSYGRQKVRLGPRPSMDVAGRPRTAGTSFRAISSIPAGFKAKSSKKGKSKDSTDSASIPEKSEASDITFTASNIAIPPMPDSPGPDEPPRPHTSSGASFVMPSFKSPAAKEKITPEKARLMKAMQLREKKKKMSMLPTPTAESEAGAPQDEVEEDRMESWKAVDEPEKNATNHLAAGETDKDDGVILSTADSAIVMEVSTSTINDHASDATQSDSHPTSPFIASSEADQSTKASSLSESTDETVQARDSSVKDTGEPRPIDNEPTEATEETPADTPAQEPTAEDKPADRTGDNDEKAVSPPTAMTEPAEKTEERSEDKDAPAAQATSQEEPSAVSAVDKSSAPAAETAKDTVEKPQAPKVDPTPERASEPAAEGKATVEAKEPQLRIPKSKFSSPDLRTAAKPQDEPPVPTIATADATAKNGGEGERAAEDASQETKSRSEGPSQPSHPDPIKTNLSVRSSKRISDDDELLDELQSAVVEEAMPVAVSPVSPTFPGAPMASSDRSSSQPSSKKPGLLSPTDIPLPKGRTVSSGAAFLNKIAQSQQPSAPVTKKTNIGSSISQRIKALEKLSSSGPEPPETRPTTTFFSAKKSTVRDPSRSPSVIDRATSFSKNSPPPASREGSPETSRQASRERSASLQNRLSVFETGASPPRGLTESVQVKAQIVRDGSQSAAGAAESRDSNGPLDLKKSPLIVDQRTEPLPESTPAAAEARKETIQEGRMSKETRRSQSRDPSPEVGRKGRRSSLSVVKDFIKDRRMSLSSPSADNLMAPTPTTPSRSPTRPPSAHQNSSRSRRVSISSRRSSMSRDASTPVGSPSAFTETSGSGDDAKSLSSDRRSGSRAGRFIRRLSSSLGGRNKSTPTGISPTLHEEVSTETVDGTPKVEAFMGDVNVQFPDNLLWKRRCMCLDSQGFLVLSTAATAGKQAGGGAGVKRYHMSEFRAPYTPEIEVQELPNSVVLDFLEGSGLQVACEDRAGQMNVLQSEYFFPYLLSNFVLSVSMRKEGYVANRVCKQVLVDAHRKHSSGQ